MPEIMHTYARATSGALSHSTIEYDDDVALDGPVVPLTGWPTPGMRLADGTDRYIGTDLRGAIVADRQ